MNICITFQREDCNGEPFRISLDTPHVNNIDEANVYAKKVLDNINLFTHDNDVLRIVTVETEGIKIS